MTLEHLLLKVIRDLPPDKQQELLDYAKQLRTESSPKKPFKSVKGLWADLGILLSEEDIDEARREAWKNFHQNDF